MPCRSDNVTVQNSRLDAHAQRCDVSPDGRWFAYFALKQGAGWDIGDAYLAVSRLPWLTALAAWRTCGTWTLGLRFVRDPGVWSVGDPDVGSLAPVRERFGMEPSRDPTFAVERRRGWTEADGTPPRDPSDPWEIRRAARIRMQKPRPGDADVHLLLTGGYAATRQGTPGRGGDVAYALAGPGGSAPLPGVQWADWAADGRLLVATTEGHLEIRDGEPGAWRIASRSDLSAMLPAPSRPPEAARRW
jgi:hypothetical protein